MQNGPTKKVLDVFEKVAKEAGFNHFFRGQAGSNRLGRGRTSFEFGDGRVETKTSNIVFEVESAGGVTNLAKYWYCLMEPSEGAALREKDLILFHVFLIATPNDYVSHRKLWGFLKARMMEEVSKVSGKKLDAELYLCNPERILEDLKDALDKFKNILRNSGPVPSKG